jgi:hypothetical protein
VDGQERRAGEPEAHAGARLDCVQADTRGDAGREWQPARVKDRGDRPARDAEVRGQELDRSRKVEGRNKHESSCERPRHIEGRGDRRDRGDACARRQRGPSNEPCTPARERCGQPEDDGGEQERRCPARRRGEQREGCRAGQPNGAEDAARPQLPAVAERAREEPDANGVARSAGQERVRERADPVAGARLDEPNVASRRDNACAPGTCGRCRRRGERERGAGEQGCRVRVDSSVFAAWHASERGFSGPLPHIHDFSNRPPSYPRGPTSPPRIR